MFAQRVVHSSKIQRTVVWSRIDADSAGEIGGGHMADKQTEKPGLGTESISSLGATERADVRTDVTDLRLALARAVASRRIPEEAITLVAKQLAQSKYKIRGIDVCALGICIDYFFDTDKWWQALPDLIRGKDSRVVGIEVFPWGIPVPDIYRVRVQQDFDAFAGKGPAGGINPTGNPIGM
jgi:hypothetical protein